MLNSSRFFTTDPTALSYILNHADVFPKSNQARRSLIDLLGNGLLVSEGHDHRRQRKILQSAFNPANIRGMIPIFYDKAYELKDKMVTLIEDPTAQCAPTPTKAGDKVKGGKQMDVMMYLGQATLDVIGLAGFDYDFKALSEPKNELAEAYRDMFSVGQSITAMAIFQAFFPGASHLVGSACCWERMLRLTRHPADEAYQSHQQQPNDSPEDWISRSSSSAATR
jgi:cytochrome P450